MMGGENAVHIRVALFNPLGNLGFACHAAAQENLLPRMTALGVGQCAQITENALLRVLADGAGVHHHHIGTFCLVNDPIAAHGEVAADFFGVCLVLLTAVGFHIGAGGNILFVPVGRDFIAKAKLHLQLLICNHISLLTHCRFPPMILSQL